jgi:SAM-dependent methyltransferase
MDDLMSTYDRTFYEDRQFNKIAARAIVPILLEYISPRSAVDLGCATGNWLSVLNEFGIADIQGIDGDWVPRQLLEIPAERFMTADLSQDIPIPRRYDLAISIEVAEHLPAERADSFVRALTQLAPVVLFSAAIPFQGGINHVNEQWPDYWAALFAEQNFLPVDCIRPRIWRHPDVVLKSYHNAQNLILFVASEHLDQNSALAREQARTSTDQLAIVHPRFFVNYSDPHRVTLDPSKADQYTSMTLGMIAPLLPVLVRRSLTSRLKGLFASRTTRA